MLEQLLQLVPEEDAARAREQLVELARPVGADHLDALVMELLGAETWITARAVAERLMLTPETSARSLARLEARGLAEGNTARPRGYRSLPFFAALPAGYAIRRPEGKSWREQIDSVCFYPDGARVVLLVVPETQRVRDGGGARLRMEGPGAGEYFTGFAAERGVLVDGDELVVEPGTTPAIASLAQASADVVAAWSTRPGG